MAEYTANLGKSRVVVPHPTTGSGTAAETKPVSLLGDIDEMNWLYDWNSKDQLKVSIERAKVA